MGLPKVGSDLRLGSDTQVMGRLAVLTASNAHSAARPPGADGGGPKMRMPSTCDSCSYKYVLSSSSYACTLRWGSGQHLILVTVGFFVE